MCHRVDTFLSTLSLRRATQYKHLLTNIMIFLSTLSLRRATKASRAATTSVAISIHALLAESDANVNRRGAECVNFYPRSPCGERRCQTLSDCRYTAFLSTLSLRRATLLINEHRTDIDLTFLSTLSLRRATRGCSFRPSPQVISIHALLAESDDLNSAYGALEGVSDFYPRSPCGERPWGCSHVILII